MTEAEWLTSKNPMSMLSLLNNQAIERKLRLFCCACCRRIWHFLKDEHLRGFVEFAERYADGQESLEGLDTRWSAGWKIWGDLQSRCPDDVQLSAESEAAGAVTRAVEGPHVNLDPVVHAANAVAAHVRDCHDVNFELGAAAGVEESKQQVSVLRDIFGNPFRPVVFSSEWRTDTTDSLARQMYDAREFNAMPILADALQDAGCDNPDVLAHCRDTQVAHVRGCWVCDLVLGKE